MTPEMVAKARRNAEAFRKQTGLGNADFRLGEIEHLPVADNSVEVIISNCVINLSPDKPQVWREMFRALKPGGRVAVSDFALLQPLPDALRRSVEALVGCVAGAVTIEETRLMIEAAGLTAIQSEAKSAAIEAMKDWNDPLYAKLRDGLPSGDKISNYVTSLYVTARKPTSRGCCGR
jgi:SAM-dependent methyltransferase